MDRRRLHERLEQLERRIPQPIYQEERERRTAEFLEHFTVWSQGRMLEEVRAEIRDVQMWQSAQDYGPVFLELVREGSIDGREELLAAGVDFTLAERSSP